MKFWTNNPYSTLAEAQQSLELFLCQFRDEEFSSLLTECCDIAFLNTTRQEGAIAVPFILRLVACREPGAWREMLCLWHEFTQAHYPHLGVAITESGVAGSGGYAPQMQAGTPVTRRYRTWCGGLDLGNSLVDAVDVTEDYEAFINKADRDRLFRFGVEVEDGRKQLHLTPLRIGEKYKHKAFTLQPQ